MTSASSDPDQDDEKTRAECSARARAEREEAFEWLHRYDDRSKLDALHERRFGVRRDEESGDDD